MKIEVEIDESNLESDEWIAVYKPGLWQLVKDLTKARIKILELEEELKSAKRS